MTNLVFVQCIDYFTEVEKAGIYGSRFFQPRTKIYTTLLFHMPRSSKCLYIEHERKLVQQNWT